MDNREYGDAGNGRGAMAEECDYSGGIVSVCMLLLSGIIEVLYVYATSENG